MVLTNAGFIYFESESLKEEKDLKPRNFKPLNDFVVTALAPSEVGDRRNVFKLIFSKDSLVTKDMTL